MDLLYFYQHNMMVENVIDLSLPQLGAHPDPVAVSLTLHTVWLGGLSPPLKQK